MRPTERPSQPMSLEEIKGFLAELMNIYFESSEDILQYLYKGQIQHDNNDLTLLIRYINNRPPVNGF